MNPEQQVIYTFNKFFSHFLKDVKNCDDTIKAKVKNHYSVIDKSSQEYISAFTESIKPYYENIDPSNEDLLNTIVISDVKLNELLDKVGEENITNVWNHIYIMAVFSMIYNNAEREHNDVLFAAVLNIVSKLSKYEDVSSELNDILDDDIRNTLSKIKYFEKETLEDSVQSEMLNMFSGMENSKICNLAKEISEEIDMSNIKLDSQEDIMKLMDFSSNSNILGNIIGKASSKIQDKMSKGELKQEDLLNEAMSMMSMFGNKGMGGAAAGLFNNPMMADMMKNMKKGKVQPRTDLARRESTREKLRKKLEERNKAAQPQVDVTLTEADP